MALVAGGAVLLGGDTVSIEVRVGTGCTLVVEDVGGTVAYPAGPARAALTGEGVSTWDVDIEVADGGRLIWETYPFVVATGARVRRSTRVRIGTESTVCLRETIVLGRTGETGGAMTSSTDVRDCAGAPVFVEDLAIDGSEPLPGVLGEASVLDTAMLFGRRSLTEDADSQILDLASPGAIARAVGTAAHASHVDAVWDDWTQSVLEPRGTQDDQVRPEAIDHGAVDRCIQTDGQSLSTPPSGSESTSPIQPPSDERPTAHEEARS
ncbi:urease accessory protein UreD [Brevibacterium casei]|uniref:Urease accessory protein UreD n=1 Tax=Brevibacterium ammoniilyticum TaxID=1046555 RepID=A0ABP9U3G6_9MICO